MRELIRGWVIICLVFLAPVVSGQKFLLVENTQTLKNFKYFMGDDIRLKIKQGGRIIEGDVTGLTDSTILIGEWEEVIFKDIEVIYRERFWIRLSRGIFLASGIGYFSLDSFNRLINNDAPVILMETLAISSGLVGLNVLLLPLNNRRLKADRWTFTCIDFFQLEANPLITP